VRQIYSFVCSLFFCLLTILLFAHYSFVCSLFLCSTKNSYKEKYDAFFVDYTKVPLLVQQHYASSINKFAKDAGVPLVRAFAS